MAARRSVLAIAIATCALTLLPLGAATAQPADEAPDPLASRPAEIAPPTPDGAPHLLDSRTADEQAADASARGLAAGGTIYGRVGFSATIGGPPVFTSGAEVRFYQQQEDGSYSLHESVETTADGYFQSPPLPAGTYAVMFFPLTPDFDVEFWEDQRYSGLRTDVEVTDDAVIKLGDIALDPRSFDVWRTFGSDRYATAVAVSKDRFAEGETASVVYLASGVTFPDALAATPAAIKRGGVVLTTRPGDLPAVVAAELDRLNPKKIIVVGGTGAVSAAVFNAVKKYAPSVVRLGGATRYDTSALIVRDAFGSDTANAFIATGRNFPDALAAGPAAGYLNAPLILVDGNAPKLSAATVDLLDDLNVTRVRVAGGTGAVSAGVYNHLKTIVGSSNTSRHSGASRYETAIQINRAVFGEFINEVGFLATGTGFADALAGGPLAGWYGAPMFLTPPTCLNPQVGEELYDYRTAGIWLIGGKGALSGNVEKLIFCG